MLDYIIYYHFTCVGKLWKDF
uniref:Uncharacterized protein n=1 Tax=Arundo donax TaxID=35708 RepID=A0A0A9CGE3_ARUDO